MIGQEDLVSMLTEIASYERGFKQRAFENAAGLIAGMSKDQYDSFINDENYDRYPGIGKSVKECIIEANNTGTMSRLESLRGTNLKSPLYDF